MTDEVTGDAVQPSSDAGTQSQQSGADGDQNLNQPTGDTLLEGGEGNQQQQQPTDGGDGNDGDGDAVAYSDFDLPEMPDGQEFDQGLLDAAVPIMQKHGLNQEQAQELINAVAPRLVEQYSSAVADHEARVDQWGKDAKADEEIGGTNGADFSANAEHAKKALAAFGTPELTRQIMSRTEGMGLGNHPEMVRFMVKVGKAIGEDGTLAGRSGDGGKQDPADVLYGDNSN